MTLLGLCVVDVFFIILAIIRFLSRLSEKKKFLAIIAYDIFEPVTIVSERKKQVRSNKYDVVVIGAGIIGLSTALQLLEQLPNTR